MTSRHKKYYQGLEQIAKEEQVSTRVANDVLYLREQAHHSPQLERQFIEQSKRGEVPDVRTFGQNTARKD